MKTDLKKLVFSALMTALCVVIGWVCKTYLTFGAVRITFENIPVLLTGMLLGPVYGATVGIASDIISALLSGFGVNPAITVGAASIGIVSGVISKYAVRSKKYPAVLLSVMTAHFVGSMVIKTIALYFMNLYAWQLLAIRIPLYLVIGLAESYIIYIILKRKIFNEAQR